MKVRLLTLGSHGDVHPFVGLGLELQRLGHFVTLATNAHFEPLARGVGLNFIAGGTDEEFRQLTKNPDLWSALRGTKVVFAAVTQYLRSAYETVTRFVQENEDGLVVASSLGIAARLARDKFRFPLVTVHLQPSPIRSLVDPPRLPGLVMPRWFPMWLKRGIMEGGDKYVVDPMICPELNRLRAELGLPPVKRVLKDWWHSPDRVIGMFPAWYAPIAPDWPPQLELTGFPLWDEQGVTHMPQALDQFLRAGPPPVAFTPGSAMTHGREFFEVAVDACARAGRRALLLTRHTEQIPHPLPPGAIHAEYAPFGELLPRVAALVHHGGIGTAAQAMRAGVPQLLMPMSHDQPDNALRMYKLGVALSLSPKRFSVRNVTRSLRALLDEPGHVAAAKKLAERFVGVRPLVDTAMKIEEVAEAFKTTHARSLVREPVGQA